MAHGFDAIQLNIILKIAAFIFLAPLIGMIVAFGFTLLVLYGGVRKQSTWIEEGDKKYYAMPDGTLRVGWLSFGSTYYYCGSDGAIVTGIYTIDGVGYQFDEEGVRQNLKTGWHEEDDKKYYVMPDGTYRVGWLSFGSTYYYCGSDGAIVYGKQKIGNNWYYFDKNGGFPLFCHMNQHRAPSLVSINPSGIVRFPHLYARAEGNMKKAAAK